jgi:hypothetical protein
MEHNGFAAVLFGIFIVFNVVFWTFWGCHVAFSKDNVTIYAWGSYGDFIKMYNSIKWTHFYKDFVTADDPSTFHSHSWVSRVGIIKFKDVGMILDPISYLRYQIWWIKKIHDDKIIKTNTNPPWKQ